MKIKQKLQSLFLWIKQFTATIPGLIVILLIFVLIMLVVWRGWFRVTVLPAAANEFYKGAVVKDMSSSLQGLNTNPLSQLGYPSVQHYPANCALVSARGIHTEVTCSAHYTAISTIKAFNLSQSEFDSRAVKLQAQLKNNGWAGSKVSLTNLVTNINKGNAQSANYTKQYGHTSCAFVTSVAYAKPQPPAITSYLDCSRVINFLGQP